MTDHAEKLIHDMGHAARQAARLLATASTETKAKAVRAAAQALRDQAAEILAANKIDMDQGLQNGLTGAMLDRLRLDEGRIKAMADGLDQVAGLPDPVGEVFATWSRPNGLQFARVRVPLGVVGIIYESRPNVTADAGALCLMAGNAAILRTGSEAMESSRAIHKAMAQGVAASGLPETAIQLVPSKDRACVGAMLKAQGLIDIIVPRGGKSLVARVQEEARVPVLAHLDGICHVYVDKAADPAKAEAIVMNAKMRRTGICGAMETLLVDRASGLAEKLVEKLLTAGCEVRGEAELQKRVAGVEAVSPEDWDTEYLDAILSVKLVDGVDEAIAHIERHGSHHTDSIVTEDQATAETFLREVDSAIVLHNASTQFADGGEFGFGAEIGIATGRLHARGPVALEGLTTYKTIVRGNGQIRPV